MTDDPEASTIECRYEFLPSAWEEGVSRRVFELLIGPDKLFPATRWGNEGKQRIPTDEDLADWLTDWYEVSHKNNRIPLFADESAGRYFFNLFRAEWGDHSLLGQLLFWPKRLDMAVPAVRALTAESLDAIVEVAQLTGAAMVSVDYRRGWGEEPVTLAARREAKRVVQGTVHAHASMGPWRGLSHIPWRLILGPHVVQTIGIERLGGLPAKHAIDHGNGLWSLQTTLDPADSTTQAGREAAAQIIASLAEFFVHTERNELAQVPPEFPPEWVPDDSRLLERYGAKLKPL